MSQIEPSNSPKKTLKHVAFMEVGDCIVSTIQTEINSFQTLVLGLTRFEQQIEYTTFNEAIYGHKKTVALLTIAQAKKGAAHD